MMYGIDPERRCKHFQCKRLRSTKCLAVADCSSCFLEGRCSSCTNGEEIQVRPYSQYSCTLSDAARGAVGGACRRDNISPNE